MASEDHLTFGRADSLLGSVNLLRYYARDIMDHMVDTERILDILEMQPSVRDREGAKELRLEGGDVSFDQVYSAYDSRQMTLKNISFHARPGEKIALVGETGAGKSTLLKLLFRLYDVSSGSIKIDHQDIRDVTIRSIRESIGVVPQVISRIPAPIRND